MVKSVLLTTIEQHEQTMCSKMWVGTVTKTMARRSSNTHQKVDPRAKSGLKKKPEAETSSMRPDAPRYFSGKVAQMSENRGACGNA